MLIETEGDAARHIVAEAEKLKALCDTYHKEFGQRGFSEMSDMITDSLHDSSMNYIIEKSDQEHEIRLATPCDCFNNYDKHERA